jgi:hypothetical protein
MNPNDGVAMIKLTDDLLIPLDRLPQDLRRRWDQAQSRKSAGENMSGVIATLLREIQGVVGVDVLLRAAHRTPQSALTIGMAENDAAIRPLSVKAREQADKEKKREGVKESA